MGRPKQSYHYKITRRSSNDLFPNEWDYELRTQSSTQFTGPFPTRKECIIDLIREIKSRGFKPIIKKVGKR